MKPIYPTRPLVVACLVMFAAAGLASCSQHQNTGPSPSGSQYSGGGTFQHVVQSGETLGMIADWYTGKSSNWTQIMSVNPGLRPERLKPGQIVLIPRSILIKDTPIPKGYVAKKRGAGNTTGVDSANTGSVKTDTGTPTKTDTVKEEDAGDAIGATGDVTAAKEAADKAAEDAAAAEKSRNDALEEAEKLDESAKAAKTETENVAKSAEDAAAAARAEADKAAEKARADAAAAAKAAADAAEAAKSGQKPAPDDAEREKLLDELLAQ